MKLNFKKVISAIVTFVVILTFVPDITVSAIATGVPGKATLQHNQYGEDIDGNYDIEVNMWYGNNGTSYTIYERFGGVGDFIPIESKSLSDGTPNVQNFIINIRGREKKGTYYYYVELKNSYGSTNTDLISVRVGGGETSDISIDKVDDENLAYQFTVEKGISEYKISNSKTNSKNFSVISSNTSAVKATIINGNILRVEGTNAGRSGLKIVDETNGYIRQIGVRVKKADGSLPGLPEYVSLGQVSEDTKTDLDFWKDTDVDDTNKRCDIRYIYINGGPLAGWRSWTSDDGGRAKKYITESLKLGMIPYFVFYNIPDSAEDYGRDLKHVNDKTYMDAYYKDLKFFLDICNEYLVDETFGIILEPDFIGYMMQQSGKKTTEIEAVGVESAYTSGILQKGKDPEFPNTIEGIVKSINYIINKNTTKANFGWQFNTWGYTEVGVPSQGLMHATETMGWDKGREFIKRAAKATAEYYMEAGILSYGADFISIDKYGFDGAYEKNAAQDPKGSCWFWGPDLWNNYLLYTKTLHETTNMPVTLWQLPVGHINTSQERSPYGSGLFKDLTNVPKNYEDSAPSYFFGDSFKPGAGNRFNYFSSNEAKDTKVTVNGDTVIYGSHIKEAMDAGVTTMLFGAGVGDSTDSVGSPPEDSYWWITKAQRYYKNPVLIVNGGNETMKEDVNCDGKVDLKDLAEITQRYNITNKDSNWDNKCDINKDLIIDIYDIVLISKKI
ncbi:dockerin type I domain-containing protein [Clostridium paraputrificum]|uniref:dockerin type I domain-containing protein n=1 Tax=Clostridium paraputrificum TaxID=29363 RepID=UPI003D342980